MIHFVIYNSMKIFWKKLTPFRPSDTFPSQGRKNFSPLAKGEMPEAEGVTNQN